MASAEIIAAGARPIPRHAEAPRYEWHRIRFRISSYGRQDSFCIRVATLGLGRRRLTRTRRTSMNPMPGAFLRLTAPSRFCEDCLAAMLATSRAALYDALQTAEDVEAWPGRCDNCGEVVTATYAYKGA